ncbi:hypothetical protein [Siphonobacter sp. BAB-5385]|uniref:hypothetical protein n=1 Tax=Siphonobacter sp. BAB-5385 TaxID=1864822 RepID=UPI001140803F|nr:hypothetical protein [Siphonobacter sp. BAB-5385]
MADTFFYISITGAQGAYFTPVSLFCKYSVLVILIYVAKNTNWKFDSEKSIVVLYKTLLYWNIVSLIHAIFVASGYWDWKFLFFSSALFLSIPLAFFLGKNLEIFQLVLFYTINFVFLYGFFIIPFALATNEELYARLMMPISLLLAFIPFLRNKYKYLLLIVSVVSILTILDFRTNIIKIAISFSVLLVYYSTKIFGPFAFKIARILLLLVPIVLLFLAVSGKFNVFTQLSEIDGYSVKTAKNDASNLTADTRTFLYLEVFKSFENINYLLFGKSAVGKYRSDFFTDLVTGDLRYSSEVGFLNTLLYSGLVGVIIYGLFITIASHYAINRSNNWLSKILGVLIASRWTLFFLEEFTQFDFNFFFLWIIIGLVSSKRFRSMNDYQVRQYLDVSKVHVLRLINLKWLGYK